jgi:NTE family protein
MLFHVGALRRLNETGWLRRVTRVSSVSGGSIVAGQLGAAWRELEFTEDGIAKRFSELVEEPLLELAGKSIDVWAVLTGLRPERIARRVAAAYDKALYHGATLQDLPLDHEGPRFVLLATNLSNGSLWRFSRPYMRDWRSPPIEWPTLPLCEAVAASSAFPPFLSPTLLSTGGPHRTDKRLVHLTDGGVYDNLGIEPVVKRCRVILVSDGGGAFAELQAPPTGWIRGTVRVLQAVDVQVRRLRRRQVMELLTSGRRQGAFWAIGTNYANYPASGAGLRCPIELTEALAQIPTRLAALAPAHRKRLINWGFAITDAALRSYVDPNIPPPDQFPYPAEGLG